MWGEFCACAWKGGSPTSTAHVCIEWVGERERERESERAREREREREREKGLSASHQEHQASLEPHTQSD